MFSKDNIIKLFEDNWGHTENSAIEIITKNKGGISALEGVLLYLYILQNKPKQIVEFSPQAGYSTTAMALGMRDIGRKGCLATFEIRKNYVDLTRKNIEARQLAEYVNIVHGNALVKVPEYLRSLTEPCGICFIDSDHTEKFAKAYIDKIFPLLPDGCLIGVHDIAALKRDDGGIGAFKTSLRGGHYKPGEELAILSYLNKHKLESCVLHAVTGGIHEAASLAVNDGFYKELEKITGIKFVKCSACCPKTLFFKIGVTNV